VAEAAVVLTAVAEEEELVALFITLQKLLLQVHIQL
jgi:hypothetical protein